MTVSALVVTMLTACSPQVDTTNPRASTSSGEALAPDGPQIPQSEALIAALASGEIDHDTYLAGYRRFSECMRSAGLPLTMESENNLVMSYSTVVGPVETECYASEFRPLDIAWQIHQEDTSEAAEIMRQCLTRRGIVPGSTLVEMDEQLLEEDITFEDCLELTG